MSLDYSKKYFLMSFRFDKNKPEDFGLIQVPSNNIFINKKDNSQWEGKELYDFGWGNEYGFIRLPKLNFQELWDLLLNSDLQENKYGAAFILETEYADNLMVHLLGILCNPSLQVNSSLKEAFNTLNLESGKNRSSIIGKSFEQVNKDYENWKLIAQKVNNILTK